jgi:K+-sensing histidine kinase KdpD
MKSPSLSLIVACATIPLIGWLDYVTGEELDVFILYLLPIAFVAWNAGARMAMVFASASAAIWFADNAVLGDAYPHRLYGWWGALVMLTVFVLAAYSVARIRKLLDHERELNRQITEAMAKIQRLSGRLPICLGCKNIADANGEWHDIEEYFTMASEDDFVFQHTVCPHCRVGSEEAKHDHDHPVAHQEKR